MDASVLVFDFTTRTVSVPKDPIKAVPTVPLPATRTVTLRRTGRP